MNDSLFLAAADLDRDNAELTRQLAEEIQKVAALRAEVAHHHRPPILSAIPDEFYGGIWWVPEGRQGWMRDASLAECAAEIRRLRAENARLAVMAEPAAGNPLYDGAL